MATMIPNLVADVNINSTITGPGAEGERILYRLLKNNDYLPKEWYVIWNRRISNQDINHQYDFLILVPRYGVLILDAKGHGYMFDEHGVFGCRARGTFTPMQSMFNDIQGAKEAFRQYLMGEFGPFGACNCLIAFIDQLSDHENRADEYDWIDRIEERLRQDGNCLKEKILSLLTQNINGQINLADYNHFFDNTMMSKIIKHFALRNGYQIYHQDDFADWDNSSILSLSTSQLKIYRKAENYSAMHIEGAAGTGKTIIAMMLAQAYANKDKKVLYVCFNRNLADDLNEKCRQNHWKNIQITNYDSLGSVTLPGAYTAIRKFLKWQNNINERAQWTPEQWQQERERIANSLWDSTSAQLNVFDVLIVDEAQDLLEKYIGSLFCLKKSDGKVFVFSDERQSLYIKGNWEFHPETLFDGMKYPIDPKTKVFCSLPLKENWRNTQKIHSHYNEIIPDDTEALGPTNGIDVETVNDVENLLQRLLKTGRRPQNIALLSIGGANIPIDQVVSANHTYTFTDKLIEWHNDMAILKTSVEGFKGLEADIVILYGDIPLPKNYAPERQDQRVKDRYVGESRAKYELYIVS